MFSPILLLMVCSFCACHKEVYEDYENFEEYKVHENYKENKDHENNEGNKDHENNEAYKENENHEDYKNCLVWNSKDSATISIRQAGTLSLIISEEDTSNLIKLKIKGHMDARDFEFFRRNLRYTEVVDLSEVIIDLYYGAGGTHEKRDVDLYAPNEIPPYAFTYSNGFFYKSSPIKEIILPEGIKGIGEYAFTNANALIYIKIPEGVEAIKDYTFYACYSLERIELPSTLTYIGRDAFAWSYINKISVAASTPPRVYDEYHYGVPETAILYVPKGTKNLYVYAPFWEEFIKIVEQ